MPNTSPNMLMPVPVVSVERGPDWSTNYNSCLSIIDQHDHTTGKGVPLTQDSLSLTAASPSFDSLNFNTSNAYALRSVRFTAQGSALALATDLGCLYEAGVDLYYNDGSGNQIRLTQGGSIVGTSGSITGLPSGTASASFAGGTFVWQSATNTAADMDAGSYIFRNATASSKGLTLSPPNAMAADYSLVLPALPASTKIMALDTSGNITAPYSVDGSTITIASNVIGIPNGALTTTQLSSSAGILGSQLATNPNFSGKSVQESSKNVVVSNTNASTNSLAVIRGYVNSSGTILSGEGFSITHGSTGVYQVTFTTALLAEQCSPVATAAGTSTPLVCLIAANAVDGTGFTINITNAATSTLTNATFSFIATGQRA